MTDVEMVAALAELGGWEVWSHNPNYCLIMALDENIVNPLEDLNAINLLERKFHFSYMLDRVTGTARKKYKLPRSPFADTMHSYIAILGSMTGTAYAQVCASARIRAVALLKATGKWREL